MDVVRFGVGGLPSAVRILPEGFPCGLLQGLLFCLVLHYLALVEESGDLPGLFSVLGNLFFLSDLHEFHGLYSLLGGLFLLHLVNFLLEMLDSVPIVFLIKFLAEILVVLIVLFKLLVSDCVDLF